MIMRIVTAIFFLLIFVAIVGYARGYLRIGNHSVLTATGLVAVTSTPSSAKVYVNSELKGSTDWHANFAPGTYIFTVVKEGYFPWQKTVTLKGEVVQSLDAILYPVNSSLSPLTNIGIVKAIPFGTQNKRIILLSDRLTDQELSPSPMLGETSIDNQEGIFVYDPSQSIVSFLPNLRKVVDYEQLGPDVDPENIEVLFSPSDLGQMIIFDMGETYEKTEIQTMIKTTDFYPPYIVPQEFKRAIIVSLNKGLDATPIDANRDSVDEIIKAWTQSKVKKLDLVLAESTYLKPLENPLGIFLRDNTRIIDISQDNTRLLYEATASASLTQVLDEKLIGTNQTPEKRNIESGSVYIYDKKEDKNYEILNSSEASKKPDPFIHPNSRNIFFDELKSISVSDFDGMNKHKVYSGPFDSSFYSITADGRVLILTNLNPELNTYGDLYAVGIR